MKDLLVCMYSVVAIYCSCLWSQTIEARSVTFHWSDCFLGSVCDVMLLRLSPSVCTVHQVLNITAIFLTSLVCVICNERSFLSQWTHWTVMSVFMYVAVCCDRQSYGGATREECRHSCHDRFTQSLPAWAAWSIVHRQTLSQACWGLWWVGSSSCSCVQSFTTGVLDNTDQLMCVK